MTGWPRAEIDASAAQLDLRMTEGDPIAFNFLVLDAASWGGVSFLSHIKADHGASTATIAEMTVTATTEGDNCDILLTSVPVAALVAGGKYVWDMQEVGGVTRFAGVLYVERQVTAP